MGRDELLHELQLLRTAHSIDDVCARFGAIHAALADISRKRSRFLEDALGAVLRHVSRFTAPHASNDDLDSDGDDGDDDSALQRVLSPLRAVELCFEFAAPLMPSADAQRDRFAMPSATAIDSDDLTRERAVCAAFLLFVLSDRALSVAQRTGPAVALRGRIALLVKRCGVPLESLVATSRFRDELHAVRDLLLPTSDDTLSDDGDDSDGDDDSDDDDNDTLVAMTAAAYGVSAYTYFVTESSQEYAFAAWSLDGLAALAFALLVERVDGAAPLTAVVAPHSWLFLLAPLITMLLQSERVPQERVCGVELLAATLQFVPDAAVHYDAPPPASSSTSFAATCAAITQRDWLTPLVQLVTNVMVSSPEPTDRALALAALQSLIAKVAVDDRFALLQRLILVCPYANVSAVLVDAVRANVVRAWAALSDDGDDVASPFTTALLGSLLRDVLLQAAERDLVLQADLIASCASLLRFLHIRDVIDRTGVRSDAPGGVSDALRRIQRRLHVRLADIVSTGTSHGPTATSYDTGDEFHRLQILEAALSATIADTQ